MTGLQVSSWGVTMKVNQEQIKANMLSMTFWTRVLFMLIFVLVLWALSLALMVICIVQTVIVLITSEINEQLQKLGAVAAVYLGQIVSFMVFATEDKPFPFSPFPENGGGGKSSDEPRSGTVAPAAAETPKKDIPVLSDAVKEDDHDDDSFYDPERDKGATR